MDLAVAFAFISLIILTYLLAINRKAFTDKVDRRTLTILGLIFLLSVVLRLCIPMLYHKVWTDEHMYMLAAKNIMTGLEAGAYMKSIGWPVILSISFMIFGLNNWVALYASLFFGSLTCVACYFMTIFVTGNKSISYISAILVATLPLHILWSSSAETNAVSVFFITLSMACSFLYYKKKRTILAWTALSSLAFTCMIRPENHILLLLFIAGAMIYKCNLKQLMLPILVVLMLIAPNLVTVYSFQASTNWIEHHTGGEEEGDNVSFGNIISNTFWMAQESFASTPLVVLIFSGMGAYLLFRKDLKLFIYAFSGLMLLWSVYSLTWLRFAAAPERMLLSFYPFIALLTGYCALIIRRRPKLTAIAISLLIVIFSLPLAISSTMHDDHYMLETQTVERAEEDIEDCTVVAALPEVLIATTELDVISLDMVNETTGCMLLFDDIFCRSQLYKNLRNSCESIRSSYDLTLFKTYERGAYNISFYHIR